MSERRPLVLVSGVPVELPTGDTLPAMPVALADLTQSGATVGQTLTWNGTVWVPTTAREVLTADRTYYVATTGSDSNDGLTAGTPFLTIQKAVDVVCSLDLSIYQATIQLADGTYTAGATLKSYVGALAPIIQGNATTPANVVVSTSGNCITNASGQTWIVSGMKLQSSGSGHGVEAAYSSTVVVRNMNFGATGGRHVLAGTSGIVVMDSNYTISGNADRHASVLLGGMISIKFGGVTITLTGTPAFSTAFALAAQSGVINLATCAFVGSATGKRYDVLANGVIYTGGGATYLPGNVTGTTATGGIYS